MSQPETKNYTEEDLKPWGNLIKGDPGISANRMSHILGITVNTLKKIISPCGVMKIPYKNEFDVYSTDSIDSLFNHPEVVKGRARKENSKKHDHSVSTEKRKTKCIEHLSSKRQDLHSLYSSIVNKLWNPATEKDLYKYELYNNFPAILWDALSPRKEYEKDAIEIITNIIWAMTKQRTWKVDKMQKKQDIPLSVIVYQNDITVDNDPEAYMNMFAAAVRHSHDSDDNQLNSPKSHRREEAINELMIISNRNWDKEIAIRKSHQSRIV